MSSKKEQEIRTLCSMCGLLHPVICEKSYGVFTKVKADTEHINSGHLCEKALAGPDLVYHPNRLNYPLKRTKPKDSPDPGWVRISWDEALDTTARRLSEIKEKYGAESILLLAVAPVAGGLQGNFQFMHRFAHCLGTPNRAETGATSCGFCRDVLSIHTFGVPFELPPWGDLKMVAPWQPQIENCACLLSIGHNLTEVENEVYYRIINAKKRLGTKIIVLDPRRTQFADNADIHMMVRPGTDGAIAMSMIHMMLSRELYDKEFVRNWTNGPFLIKTDNGAILTEQDISVQGSSERYVIWDESTGNPVIYDPATISYESRNAIPALMGTYTIKLADGEEISCKTALQLLAERAAQYDPKTVEKISWVPAKDIEQAAIWMATLKPSAYLTLTGVEQNTNAAQTNRAIHVMYALTGNFDKPGGNVVYPFPPTYLNDCEGSEFLSPEQKAKRLGSVDRPIGSCLTGYITHYDAYKAILTGKPYPLKGGIAFGAAHLSVGTDALKGREAYRKLEFLAVSELFMTPTASVADIVMPATSGWETPTVSASEAPMYVFPHNTVLQYREPIVSPLYERKTDLTIICELAKRLGLADKFFGGDPEACLRFKIEPSGYTLEDLKNTPGGVYFPNFEEPVYQKYAQQDPETGYYRGVKTPTKKLEVYSVTFKKHGYDPLPDYTEPMISPVSQPELAKKYPLMLIDARRKWMVQSQYAQLPSIRKNMPYAFVDIHPDTAAKYGIKDGDMVYIETKEGKITQQAHVTDTIHPQVVCATFGWWAGCPQLGMPESDSFSSEGANYTLLINGIDYHDPIAGCIPLNGYLCSITKKDG